MSRLAILLCGLLLVTGCGDDKKVQRGAVQRGGGGRVARPKVAKKKVVEAAVDPKKLPAKLRNIDWDASDELAQGSQDGHRDPFRIYVDEVEMEPDDQAAKPKNVQLKGPLQRFAVGELQLIAIVTGTPIHKAMVVDPNGMGHVIRVGDIVGNDRPVRVTRITRNEVVFKPLVVPNPEEQMLPELTKRLLTEEELQELLP